MILTNLIGSEFVKKPDVRDLAGKPKLGAHLCSSGAGVFCAFCPCDQGLTQVSVPKILVSITVLEYQSSRLEFSRTRVSDDLYP